MVRGRLDTRTAFALALLMVGAVFWIHLTLGGSVGMSPAEFLRELFRGPVSGGNDPLNLIIWQIRGPRACAALLAGGMLGVAGAALQALYRNPLAEPFTLGASGGASAGGVLALLLGFGAWWGGLGVVFGALAGAFAVLALVLGLSRSRLYLLLAGLAAGTMTAAMTNIMLILAGRDSNQILLWLMGSTASVPWVKVIAMGVTLVVGFVVLWLKSPALNVVAVTESGAESIGVDVLRLSRVVLVGVGGLTAVAVGSVGIIGFIGLVAPLLARFVVGSDARRVLPFSVLTGAILLSLADVLAARLLPGTELPVGAVTAVLGAPALLWAVYKRETQ